MADDLTISDLARATGVAEATLRAWERRHGFPAAQRTSGGHRRYSGSDVARVRLVIAERDRGLGLARAIERAAGLAQRPHTSVFARLRRERRDLGTAILRRERLLELTRAIEDESCAHAERSVLIGAFQTDGAFARSRERWSALARGTAHAVALAAFPRTDLRPRPVHVRHAPDHPMAREWAVICDAPGHAACVVAWEVPPRRGGPPEFETLLSFEPEVVRAAAETCVDVVAEHAPPLAAELHRRLAAHPPAPTGTQLPMAASVITRMLRMA